MLNLADIGLLQGDNNLNQAIALNLHSSPIIAASQIYTRHHRYIDIIQRTDAFLALLF